MMVWEQNLIYGWKKKKTILGQFQKYLEKFLLSPSKKASQSTSMYGIGMVSVFFYKKFFSFF